VIHTFAKPDHPKNWAHAVVDWHSANQVGSDPATVAQTLLVSDGAVGTLLVLYDDPGAAQPVIRTLPAAFPVNPSVQLGRDGRTLLVGQDQKVTLYDPVTDTLRVVSFARRCTPPLPPAKVNLSDFGFGQWQDGTIWLRRDNELLLDDGHGGQRCVDLLRFTSDAHPDWSIGYYSFFNPDELWLGIEQGARGYLWIGWDELTKASRPLGH
jgi:hypothetical protein